MMKHTLEERLRGLELKAPDGLGLRALAKGTAFAAPSTSVQRHTRVAKGIAAATLVVAANGVAAAVAPGYGELLAQAPGIGQLAQPLLSWTGLRGDDVTPLAASARSAGHEVRVLGVYADGTRTVVLVDVDGRGLFNPTTPDAGEPGPVVEVATLVGVGGREYHTRPYVIPEGHSVPIPFEPVADVRPGETVALTLHVTRLMSHPNSDPIEGDWKIPFEVTIGGSSELPLPPPGEANGNRFTFTSATLSGRLLTLRWEVAGPTVEESDGSPIRRTHLIGTGSSHSRPPCT